MASLLHKENELIFSKENLLETTEIHVVSDRNIHITFLIV